MGPPRAHNQNRKGCVLALADRWWWRSAQEGRRSRSRDAGMHARDALPRQVVKRCEGTGNDQLSIRLDLHAEHLGPEDVQCSLASTARVEAVIQLTVGHEPGQ